MKKTITKQEVEALLKKELRSNVKYRCFALAIDILEIWKTVEYNLPFIRINNYIRDENYLYSTGKNNLSRKNLDKVKKYLIENKLWEVF